MDDSDDIAGLLRHFQQLDDDKRREMERELAKSPEQRDREAIQRILAVLEPNDDERRERMLRAAMMLDSE